MTYPCGDWSCLDNVLLQERKEYIQPAAWWGVSPGYLTTRSVSGAESELTRRKSGEAPWLGRSAHVMIGFYLTLFLWSKEDSVLNFFTLAVGEPNFKLTTQGGCVVNLVKNNLAGDDITLFRC